VTTTPDRDALDRALADWQQQVERVRANLQALQDSPTYSLVRQGLPLAGQSRALLAGPIQAAGELADQFALLDGQVARAAELRASLRPLLPNDKTLREIDRLLNGASVPVAGPDIPLAQRNLLDDPSQPQITLRQLVATMQAAFAAARDSISQYDTALARARPALEAADRQLAQLTARARTVGPGLQPQLEATHAAIALARQQLLDDPIGAAASFEQRIRTELERLDGQIRQLERDQAEAQAALARAQARQRRAERHLEPAQVAGLGAWLADIANAVAAGKFAAARVGLERWQAAAEPVFGPLERCTEQLDLLKALRAKCQQLRARGITIAPEVDALALQAEAALRAQPPDLATASQLVRQYQAALARR
jgi:DNA repair exonuclease SbcCD ATPase subunit